MKDELARSVRRELSGTYFNENHLQFAKNILRPPDDFPKIYKILWECFLFDPHKYRLWMKFSEFYKNFPTTCRELFKQVHGSYVVKLLWTNCSFHTENIRTLIVLYRPHFSRSLRQDCSPNKLPYEPHNC